MNWYNISAIIISIIGLGLSITNMYKNQFTMKNEYFRWASSREMINARHFIRSAEKLSKDDKYVPEILNFYNYWGLMVRQRHLPLSVFNSASGYNVLELYEKLHPVITEEQKRTKLYARDFEWLYFKIKSKFYK